LKRLALYQNKLNILILLFILMGCTSTPNVDVGKVTIILDPVRTAEIRKD